MELLKKIQEKTVLAKDFKRQDIDKIIKAFNKNIWKEIIANRDGVELMSRLGKIFVGTCKAPRKENIDIPKSIKYGVIVTHKNWETDGNLAKIFYTNKENRYNFKHNEVWNFTAHRDFKRTLAKTYKEDWTKYIKVEPNKHFLQQIKTQYRKDRIEEKMKAVPVEEYNEFDMS